jgi:acetylornithine deacetylase/succinyl-diaminopimelate desuccinylase-like protein
VIARRATAWKAAIGAILMLAGPAAAQTLRPDQRAFLDTYRELVETNTTASAGSCTLAAERMAARLRGAGYSGADVELFVPEGHPRDGGLIARLNGSDPSLGAVLLLAHLDVVEARREDWTRDPFTLVEENGNFYGRGVMDDKAQAAIWVDSLIRFRAEGYRPRRTIKVALTCGEEGGGGVNGAEWLVAHRRDAVAAAFALNEGGGGLQDAGGRPIHLSLQIGEKTSRTFNLEATNPGGHSSLPAPDNAIYDMAAALSRIAVFRFPVQFNEVSREYFLRLSRIVGGAQSEAMRALVADPADEAAEATLAANRFYNALLRTTCVATTIEGGHAVNALPQRVRATVNCRIFPGGSPDEVREILMRTIGNPAVTVTLQSDSPRAVAVPPPLDPAIFRPAEMLARRMFPGVPLLPTPLTAATDAVHLSNAGIPTYGVPGIFIGPDGNGIHGLNEHIGVDTLYRGRDYLHALIRLYAD